MRNNFRLKLGSAPFCCGLHSAKRSAPPTLHLHPPTFRPKHISIRSLANSNVSTPYNPRDGSQRSLYVCSVCEKGPFSVNWYADPDWIVRHAFVLVQHAGTTLFRCPGKLTWTAETCWRDQRLRMDRGPFPIVHISNL